MPYLLPRGAWKLFWTEQLWSFTFNITVEESLMKMPQRPENMVEVTEESHVCAIPHDKGQEWK